MPFRQEENGEKKVMVETNDVAHLLCKCFLMLSHAVEHLFFWISLDYSQNFEL